MTSWVVPASSKLLRKRAAFPTSTRYELIFPFDYHSLTFATDFYSPAMTDNRIPTSQLEAFFEEVEEACDQFSIFKSWTDFFYVSIYVPLIAVILLVHLFEKTSEGLATGIFFAGILLTLGVIAVNLLRTTKDIERYRNKIIGLINYANQNLYEIMGLKWEISPKNFEWLQLTLVYRVDKEPNKALFRDDQEERREYLGGKSQATYPVFVSNKLDCVRQDMPPSTRACLVFPFDYKSFCFNTSFYKEELTEGRLKFHDLIEFEKKIAVGFGKAKKSVWSYGATFMQALTIVGCIISSVVYTHANLYNTRRILALVLGVMIVHLIQILKEFKTKKLLAEERAHVIDFIQKENEKTQPVGLKWVLSPSDVDWLELWFEYKFTETETFDTLTRTSVSISEDNSGAADSNQLL